MNFKTLMIIKAIVSLFFGIIILSIPGFLLSLFGTELSYGGMFTAREYGAALIGITCLTWIGRNAGESISTKAIIVALFIYDLIGFVVTIINVLSGVLNPLGWLIVVVYLFFTIGFGYYLNHTISES